MRFDGDLSLDPELEVGEIVELDAPFWEAQRRTLDGR